MFSLPADFSKESIIQYAHLNESYSDDMVVETYGQITSTEINASGRSIELLPNVNIKQLEDYVIFSKSLGIGFNYTLNASCFSNFELTESGSKSIKAFVSDLYNIGINTFTVSLPAVIEIIQSMNINCNVVVSTICEINSAFKAAYYEKMKVARIVLDNDIIRDFKTIQAISQLFSGEIEVIVNSCCIKDCPYKIFHYNSSAHSGHMNENIDQYYKKHCSRIKNEDPVNLLKMHWIRPEDLYYYNKIGVTHYKFQGRANIKQRDPVKAIHNYFNYEYHGDLLELLSLYKKSNNAYHIDNTQLNGFLCELINSKHQCTGLCGSCMICYKYAQKALSSH